MWLGWIPEGTPEKKLRAHNGRVHVVLIIDNKLGLSISELDRYLGSPVAFLLSFAMPARIMDERVSLNTRRTFGTYAAANLRRILEQVLEGMQFYLTNMTCTHWTHRHPRCGLPAISPPNTDPRPKDIIVASANRDIGNPRLEHCQ